MQITYLYNIRIYSGDYGFHVCDDYGNLVYLGQSTNFNWQLSDMADYCYDQLNHW